MEFPTYGEVFDAIYDIEEIYLSFIEQYLSKNGLNLELGCGAGRILLPMAKRGYRMIGLDRSKEMLDKLKAKAEELHIEQKIQLIQSDFIHLDSHGVYDTVYFSTDTFSMVESVVERFEIVKMISSRLAKGGTLIIPLNNPVSYLGTPCQWFNHQGTIPKKGMIRIIEERKIHPERCMRDGHKWEIFSPENQTYGIVQEQKRALSIITRNEIKILFRENRIRLKEEYGYFDKSPLTTDSTKSIFIGEKE